jgi:hypothetical protein
MDFTPLAYHLEQVEALNGRLNKILGLCNAIMPHVHCTCDFTEQNQHTGCPQYLIQQLGMIAAKIK